jgi:hypothetical protein
VARECPIVKAFQIHEVAERHEQGVECRFFQRNVAIGRVLQCHRPYVTACGHRQYRVGIGHEGVDDGWVELAAAPGAHHRHRAIGAEFALVDFCHVGDVRDTHLDGNGVAFCGEGQPAAVEAFEGVAQRRLHVVTQPDSLGQQCRRHAVRVDQLRNVAPASTYSADRVFRRCSSDSA